MKKLGCLVVLVILALALWATRGMWLARIRGDRADSAAATGWQTLTPEGAERARVALERLRSPRGPAFTTVAAGDIGAHIYQEITRTLVRTSDSAQAAAIGDRLFIRAVVPVASLGDKSALGPLAMLLGDRERMQLGGTLRIIRPGLAEFRVSEVRIRELALPQALIDRLTERMAARDRDPALARGALPVRTPDYIGDVRVLNGQITLYRTAVTSTPAPATKR